MKPIPALLLSLTLCTTLGATSNASEINMSWQWQSTDGQRKHFQLTTDDQVMAASRHEMSLLEASLTNPLETLYAYISPRLYNSINLINQSSPETATKFRNLEQAFTLRDNSMESLLFWQAYQQYQEDAFYQMRVVPCVHPANRKLPCVRPDYSQLFYHFKGQLKPLAQQFAAKDLATSVSLLQEWLNAIPTQPEQLDHFAPPLQALQDNKADSDEKALLMASLLAELAPQYVLSIIYPDISIGSVSPAWLAITADSGVPGDVVVINNQRHVLLTGSSLLAQQMTMAKIPLISESLY
ncbi:MULTISPECIES: hypothetical protein [Aeromonas]|uniref:Uncharacterized protein n=1 Tax=Aeromonas allosaccharophila TaxID=656 RepID=A0A7T2PCK4_9GAMM|nr:MULTISPECIES: hypothetical protein [Aeromonas]MCE9951627.1 hypothetical protein [Aeromonas allosaccharophila]MEB8286191.1 hypothetical protein [Aeromonas veronii]QPR53290.1 hypothetical protein I6G90_12455 [Aeromonas allosaccharophila]TNI94109.1 hypothetical protein CF120_03560 [Aeromonas allosaccharophila]BBU06249.1 hypothetical protein WP9W18E04_35880 [Aeromonas veronii]